MAECIKLYGCRLSAGQQYWLFLLANDFLSLVLLFQSGFIAYADYRNFDGLRLKCLFPFVTAPVSMSRIYLGNAATSWPKPESVYLAVDRTQRNVGVSAARGGYSSSVLAGKIIKQTRQSVGALIGSDDASRVALTSGCTDSLSTAIFGFLKQGDHAITTAADHNSVVRPLVHLRDTGVIDLTIVGCDGDGLVTVSYTHLTLPTICSV